MLATFHIDNAKGRVSAVRLNHDLRQDVAVIAVFESQFAGDIIYVRKADRFYRVCRHKGADGGIAIDRCAFDIDAVQREFHVFGTGF